jgi:hypothetical protein
MPLPAGFKVNGTDVTSTKHSPIPPCVRKIQGLLDKLPADELLTSAELADRLGMSMGGYGLQHATLADYREKVDGKLFWGSRTSIAVLREKLEESYVPEPYPEDWAAEEPK